MWLALPPAAPKGTERWYYIRVTCSKLFIAGRWVRTYYNKTLGMVAREDRGRITCYVDIPRYFKRGAKIVHGAQKPLQGGEFNGIE